MRAGANIAPSHFLPRPRRAEFPYGCLRVFTFGKGSAMRMKLTMCASVMVLACGGVVTADLPRFAICTDAGEQTGPGVYGDVVAWSDNRNGNWDVYGKNLQTGVERPICTNGADQWNVAINGNLVVFEDNRNGGTDIYGYNLVTEAEIEIRKGDWSAGNPDAAGNTVVWMDQRNALANWRWDIYGYDVATGQEFEVCANSGWQGYPAISGDTIIWWDNQGSGNELHGMGVSTGNKFFIHAPPRANMGPLDVDGDIVVWYDTRRGVEEADIYGYDLSTGEEFPICTAQGSQQAPVISGDYVVWMDKRNGVWDIYGYDLVSREEFAIDTSPGAQEHPAVNGATVVWEDHASPTTGPDIYGATIPERNTLTWDGTDPAAWTSAHWNPGPVAPSGGEPMVVDSGTVTVSTDLTALSAGSLAIASGAPGGIVSIGPAGTLIVTDGVTVGAGGTLSIDGMLVAPLVTISGGTLTSDAGAGTGAIDGSLTLTDGATFAVEATGVAMDRLDCTGAVTIDPSASLDITLAGFPGPALGMAMPLIGADGGLAGTFGTVNGVLLAGNKACAVTYQANGATVTVVRPGDFEVDGDVDFSDFTYLAANYGQSGKSWVDGDADGDGDVDFTDFTHLGANYGSDSDSSAEAPSAGTVELHVNAVTGEMWLVGNGATLSGYSITSAAGSLVPDGDGAAPFQFYLANETDDISAASLGVGVLVDGELALGAAFDTTPPLSLPPDLMFSYGVFGQGGSVSGDVILVPEPATLGLLAMGGLAMMRRRRDR